ncbi:ribose-5-phosphate isomerase RpiA [Candidatus Methylomirabilis sp.]|uniref:ribose-5-phosphate isomerase RpiA n=1 Tax=Candidatus Methylomirabilis sp. TaxID=2032687 RepID=UPI002A5EA7AB|nr:ribose-5-phosphate isomerase RpiA [Candidatus Methylomirabilis sp.]
MIQQPHPNNQQLSPNAPGTPRAQSSMESIALEFIKDGDVVGLGTGRAATAFVRALGDAVKTGLRVTAVSTSQVTAALAAQLGIPLATLDEVSSIDVTFDGADEVDPRLDLIKGYGGALIREKIVAASSRRLVILVGAEKLVPVLGSRGILPVEVVPFGLPLCRRRLAELGCRPAIREQNGQPFVTDNGNHILDCSISPLPDPASFEQTILGIPGVVGTGLFIGMADTVLVQDSDTVSVQHRGDR